LANKRHLNILRGGVRTWNKWREEHPKIQPDLSGAELNNARLGFANLRGANLREAMLFGANLSNADLRGAALVRTNLREAVLEECSIFGGLHAAIGV
jgi:Pentapeptide repeats (8 copies)